MIDKLRRFERVAEYYRDNLPELLVQESQEFESFIVELNIDQMYHKGADARGFEIRPRYAPSTVRQKRREGKPADRVTLRDEGDFHRSIFVIFDGDKLIFNADDSKAVKLFKKYGPDLLGLDADSLDKLTIEIKPGIVARFRKDLDL